ncbi:hypothetical protein BJY04DRAFT_215102 [Aspergillus karnatakaensis]|uniref:putative RNA exonuclease Rex3 n=1 Tax=Aspergillus karnatakaensis TaxID=1810916 RepID=UPI003CCCE36E
MFAPLGLFKDVPCPQGEQCSLFTCIFSHREVVSKPVTRIQSLEEGEIDEPAPKRIKLDPQSEKKEVIPQAKSGPPIKTTSAPIRKPATPAPKVEKPRPLSSHSPGTKATPVKQAVTQSSGSSRPPRQAPKESLNPRMLPKAPASFNVRSAILKKLHSTLCTLNTMLVKDKSLKDKCLILTPDELVTMALDEEEKVAKDNPTIYPNIIKLRIVKLSKLTKEDWEKELKVYLNKKYYKLTPIGAPAVKDPKESNPFTTLTPAEELAVVSRLVTPLHGLEEHGYVTRAPSDAEIETAQKGVLESKGWEKCDRCGGRFQVFPGRREDGTLTTGGLCTHHPGKALYPPKKKTDHVTGSREAYFTCCNETLGQSPGCTKGETHVFKVSEVKRLASILQFETTPANPSLDAKNPQPICFDCEMGYTTLGLELIRLTAVSWPQGQKVLDILVRPLGEVLDLNSRFSGVYPEHYANALPYSSSEHPSDPPPSEPSSSSEPKSNPIPDQTQLQVVPSPSAARSLLFQLLTPETPLIGHAIDNDLNACRVIHPTIIDTALLYPHPGGGLPYRMALRTLARKFLDRDIQVGGRGHDSLEDAVATGDLIRVKAQEVMRGLRREGWVVRGGRLVNGDERGVEVEEFV